MAAASWYSFGIAWSPARYSTAKSGMPRQMPMRMRAGSAVSSVDSQLMRPIQKNSRIVLTSPYGWYMNFQTMATTICDMAMGKKYAKRTSDRPGIWRFSRRASARARNHSGSATPNMYLAETQKDWWKSGFSQSKVQFRSPVNTGG